MRPFGGGVAEPKGDAGVAWARWEPKRFHSFQTGEQEILGRVWIPHKRFPDDRLGETRAVPRSSAGNPRLDGLEFPVRSRALFVNSPLQGLRIGVCSGDLVLVASA